MSAKGERGKACLLKKYVVEFHYLFIQSVIQQVHMKCV